MVGGDDMNVPENLLGRATRGRRALLTPSPAEEENDRQREFEELDRMAGIASNPSDEEEEDDVENR